MLPMISRMNDVNFFPTMFNDFFNDNDFWMTTRKNNVTSPAINVKEDAKDYTVEVAAPGMNKDDFKISVDKAGNLVIAMEKKDEKKDENKEHKYLRREFSYSKFQQSFSLPENAEGDKIAAKMNDGALTITIPKSPAAPAAEVARQIAIS